RSGGWWILGQRCCSLSLWAVNGCCCRDWLWRRFRGWGCFHFGCWSLQRSLSWAHLDQALNGPDEMLAVRGSGRDRAVGGARPSMREYIIVGNHFQAAAWHRNKCTIATQRSGI